MNTLREKLVKFLKSEDGPTAVEYAVMVALIIVVSIAAIGALGTKVSGTFVATEKAISTASQLKAYPQGQFVNYLGVIKKRPLFKGVLLLADNNTLRSLSTIYASLFVFPSVTLPKGVSHAHFTRKAAQVF